MMQDGNGNANVKLRQLNELPPDELIYLLNRAGAATTNPKWRQQHAQKLDRYIYDRYGLASATAWQRLINSIKGGFDTFMMAIGEIMAFFQSIILGRVVPALLVPLAAYVETTVIYDGLRSMLALNDHGQEVALITAVIMELFYLGMCFAMASQPQEKGYSQIAKLIGVVMILFGTIGRIGPAKLDQLGYELFGFGTDRGIAIGLSDALSPLTLGILTFAFLLGQVFVVRVLYNATKHLLGKESLSQRLATVNLTEAQNAVLVEELLWRIRLSRSPLQEADLLDYLRRRS